MAGMWGQGGGVFTPQATIVSATATCAQGLSFIIMITISQKERENKYNLRVLVHLL